MAAREIAETQGFARILKQLSKKYPDLEDRVTDALKIYAALGPTPRSAQIPGLDGKPVFKERLPLRDRGGKGGARIIYYCDSGKVVPLFLYVKASREDVPVNEIRDALKVAHLL